MKDSIQAWDVIERSKKQLNNFYNGDSWVT